MLLIVMCDHPLVEAVFQNLQPLMGNSPLHFLLTCSGGADSTALLMIFHWLQPRLLCRLSAVSVNHNIRGAEESAADSAFVGDLCRRLNPPIPCIIEDIPVGAVACCARERKRGIEDAARTLRYRIFEKTALSVGADFIVTAHNKNDVYETVLMRLFQGGGTATLRTMSVRRGIYVRPLITADRDGIESFLRQQGLTWREDSTNMQNMYLRNRIRHFLVPALNDTFGAWHTGFDKTLQRISLDCSFCEAALETMHTAFTGAKDWENCSHGAITISTAFFDALPPALRLRLLEQGCVRLNIERRIPLGILLRMVSGNNRIKITAAGDLRMERRGNRLFLFKHATYHRLYNKRSYILSIKQCGTYPYPLGYLEVYENRCGFFLKDKNDSKGGVGPFMLPITVRSRHEGDKIQMRCGKLKTVKKILNEWGVDSLARALLPIIIENNHIRALYGSLLGYKDWFVEEK